MIDYQRLFHTGIRVADIDCAMAEMGATLGLSWSTVQYNPSQAIWTPEQGMEKVPLTFVYSCEGPQHIELLQGAAGTLWDGYEQPGVHHVGVWVDDVAAETQRCVDAGWRVAAAAASPDDGFGAFVYVVPPSGPMVELVWSVLTPHFETWWGGAKLGRERDADD